MPRISENLELQDLLTTFSIPPSMSNSTTMTTAILSLPSLFLALPPSPPTTPLPNLELDPVRKGRLPKDARLRECTKCKGRTEMRDGANGEPGKRAGVEMA